LIVNGAYRRSNSQRTKSLLQDSRTFEELRSIQSGSINTSIDFGALLRLAAVCIIDFDNITATDMHLRAVIKAEPAEENRKILYERELENLGLPTIASSPYIRALQDCIGHDSLEQSAGAGQQRCMVLEWMDSDLWRSRFNKMQPGSDLPRTVAKSVLEALLVFSDLRGVHTDINPNNVFLSGLETTTPSVKVGDLGNLLGEGIDSVRLQGHAIRAPEVWKGYGCWSASDVWSLGVTVRMSFKTSQYSPLKRLYMVHWLATKPIFGASDKIIEGMTEAWCIAKIKRLVGPLGAPVKPEYGEEFAAADFLESKPFQLSESSEPAPFITVGSIRQELEQIPDGRVTNECIDFIASLLVIDHTKRPSAREALNHPFITGV